MDKGEKQWLDYWFRCLKDSAMSDIDLKSFDNNLVFIDEFSPVVKSVSEQNDCLNKCKGILDRLNPGKSASKEADVLISPFLFKRAKAKSGTFSPFWYRAHIDYHGNLSVPNDIMPIVPRKYLSPFIENASDESFVFGDLDDVSTKLSFLQDEEFHSYGEYIVCIHEVFKSITGSESFAKYEKNYKPNETDNYKAYGHIVKYKTGVIVFLTEDQNTDKTIKAIIDLYKDLCSRTVFPELLSKMISGNTTTKPFLSEDKWIKTSGSHLGQMKDNISLSFSQRRSLYTILEQWDDTPVHAVTGPPGTGKTTLLQSIVADMVVKSVFKEEPCIIWGSAATNQAVTNLIDSFSTEGKNSRWLPTTDSPFKGGYGTFLPSSTVDNKTLEDKNYIKYDYNEKRNTGTFYAIENNEYLDTAKEAYLKEARSFLKLSDNCSIEDVVQKLKNLIIILHELLQNFTSCTQNIVDSLSKFPKYSDNGTLLCGVINDDLSTYGHMKESILINIESLRKKELEINNSIIKYKGLIKDAENKKIVLEKTKKELEDKKNKVTYSDNHISVLMRLFFGKKIHKKNAELIKKYEQDIRINQEKLSKEAKTIRLGNKELETSNKKREELNISIEENIKILEIEEHIKEINKILTSENEWESYIKYFNLKETVFPTREGYAFYDNLDGFRAKMFILAVRYWEGRWLLEAEDVVNNFEEEVSQNDEESVKRMFRRYAMLTPCFVSTFHSTPKKLSYYDSKANKRKYLTDFVDCLIIDEAGQASPEIGMAIFALAKKAVVVGDTKQIEPVWGILPSVDIANLKKFQLPYDNSEYICARRCSCGSIMKVAQTSCSVKDDSFEEKGNLLLEHRRCLPKIIQYCSKLAYNSKIKALRTKNNDTLFPEMAFYNVTCDCKTKNGNKRENACESNAICEWLEKNKKKIEEKYGPIEKQVGILTPFCGQKEKLRQDLKDYGFAVNDIKLGTIHALQGAERNIILFSSVYTEKDNITNKFFDRNVNMLNVAVSRAKDSFILFGDERIFKVDSTPSGQLFEIVSKYRYNPDSESFSYPAQ